MPGLLDFARSPGGRQLLANLGAGLLMGGFPQPYGRSRAQQMAPFMFQGVQGLASAPRREQERRFREMQMQAMEAKLAEQKRAGVARGRLGTYLQHGARTGRELLSREGPPGGPQLPGGIDPQMAGLLMDIAPEKAIGLLTREPKAPPSETDVAGFRRFTTGPQAGERMFPGAVAAAKAPKTRKVVRGDQVVTEEWNPATGQWKQVGAGERRAGVEVKFPDKTTTKIANESYNKADTQRGMALDAELMMSLLDQGLDTDALTPIGTKLSGYLASIGVNVNSQLPMAEAFRSLSNVAALRLRNPASGLGLTGNTSDRDVRFLKEAVAGLGNTREANYIILMTARAKARRLADLAELKAIHIEEANSLKGYAEKRRQFIEGTPLFTPEEQERIQELARLSQGQAEAETPEEELDKTLRDLGLIK